MRREKGSRKVEKKVVIIKFSKMYFINNEYFGIYVIIKFFFEI